MLGQSLKLAAKKRKQDIIEKSSSMPSRHSRFGAMVTVNKQLPGAPLQIKKNMFCKESFLPSDLYRTCAGKKPIPDPTPRVYLNDSVRKCLLEAAELLLRTGGYDTLMRSVLAEMQVDGSIFLPEDSNMYFWFGGFMMSIFRSTTKRCVRSCFELAVFVCVCMLGFVFILV